MESIKRKVIRWLINRADSSELSEIVQEVLRRYGKLFAQEEVVFLSLPRHDFQERQRIIQSVLQIEQQHKNEPVLADRLKFTLWERT